MLILRWSGASETFCSSIEASAGGAVLLIVVPGEGDFRIGEARRRPSDGRPRFASGSICGTLRGSVSAQPPSTSPSSDQSRTRDDQRPGVGRAFLNKVLSDPKTLVTVTGLLLYAVVRTSYVIFYESFGLTPDDLGWGYLDLLGQAAVTLVGLTAIGGVLLSLYIVFFHVGAPFVRDQVREMVRRFKEIAHARRKGKGERRQEENRGPHHAEHADAQPADEQRRGQFSSALGSAAALVAVGIYFWALSTVGPQHTVALVVTSCFIAAFWVSLCVAWFKGLDEAGRKRLDREIVIAMVISFVLAAVVLVAQAATDAQAVREGRSARPTGLGTRLASWGAERATVRWTSEAPARKFPGIEAQCLMYLGKSDGTAYFYRPQTKETLRLPASDLAVVTKDVTLPCVGR